ncbi:TPA: DUF2326 domain-containing protein [Legionella pneumophila]|uniref:DUF2326 domain-containing protein n=1 Tax=Legionella pneumophila TaxID=446 RepID=UPI00077842F3|nr:DUF2326 domain-containing protein [Legionella pneumophila]HCC3234912.1 DUF2326 domain-containing protein [Legionella pneumophila subsp. pneumophila]HAT8621967.1 DUF2326 domain-containing protein [Legionella pneumophila]HAU9853220.1 DUF2326 domain-containing protein [Legionella pneumophila]HAU9908217.1 DUF2326 domain-containing protein [Legionella pneumophila]HAV0029395.1 DUF2326 domain-containing protein [Legionella pneumophila]
MIHGVYSSKSSFKHVQFNKGLNVVIAERKEGSDKTKTTNSRGKSTLISIINFCLGSNASNSGLCIEQLTGWDFSIDITLLGNRVQITREVDNPNKVFIVGDISGWPIKLEYDEELRKYFLGLDKWKQFLGEALFDVHQTSGISFRSLLSYFVRSGVEAYSKPLKFYSSQADNLAHVYNAFLIGLDQKYATKWCELDRQDKALKALGEAIKAGLHETKGELETKKIELEEELSKGRKILSDFKVYEKYKEIQVEANELTSKIHQLANENITERRKLEHYESSIIEETPPDDEKLKMIYKETGIVFSDSVQRTLEEAFDFHKQILKNRTAFLEAEIVRIRNKIVQRDELIKNLSDKRSSCLEILNTHGALDEYSRLQEQNTKIQEKLEKILSKIEDIRDQTKKRQNIKLSRIELDKEASIDYEEKRRFWEQAIRLFNEFAKALYGVNGEFVIDISEKGYQFNVDIPGGRGGGIGKMKIFCYDLMNMCMQKILGREIDFLVHDSILYEGVDERQVAHAIEQAAVKADFYNFQYIMTINSDMIPYNDFNKEFNFDNYIKLRLSDEDESGSLLGINF